MAVRLPLTRGAAVPRTPSQEPGSEKPSNSERRASSRRGSRSTLGRRTGESRSADERRRRFDRAARVKRRTTLQRFIDKYDMEMFGQVLAQMAHTVFGKRATVVAHLRRRDGEEYVAYVIDAADPTAAVRYDAFLPRERTFWSLFSALPKPKAPFAVAIRPARGWCRVEALAPVFDAGAEDEEGEG